MKTLDKIYIQTNAGEALSSKWTTIPFRDFENTEYICKDALLKWAKGEIMPGNSAEGKGWNLALQTLIEKINTL